MSAIATVFEFDSRELRTTVIEGEPWFVAADICRVLGLRNPTMALRALDDDEKGLSQIETPGGVQNMAVVNESGLYTLIVRSDKPNAKQFRRWVTSEVLPAIRKSGGYGITERDTNQPAIPQTFAEALRLAADLQEQNEAQARELEAAAPKVEYVDQFLRNDDSCTLRTFAKQVGVKEKELREHLIARKVIYRQPVGKRFSESKQRWVDECLYQPYATHTQWFTVGDQPRAPRLFNGQMRTTLYVTPAGKVGIARLLDRHPVSQVAIEGASA